MKKSLFFVSIIALAVLTSCVNDELRESAAADKLAGVDSQLEAVMASAEDIKAELSATDAQISALLKKGYISKEIEKI